MFQCTVNLCQLSGPVYIREPTDRQEEGAGEDKETVVQQEI